MNEIRKFRASLRILEREMALALESQSSCCGVSPAQCHLLLELAARGSETVSGLAEAFSLDKSTLSRTVESLRRSGLVSCERGESDRRIVRASLTPKGISSADRINASCDEHYRRALEGIEGGKRGLLFEGTELLGTMMRKLRSEAEKDGVDARGL